MRHIIIKVLHLFFSFQLIFSSGSAAAQIYRWVDDSGRVQFSDSPDPNYHSQVLTSTAHSVRPSIDVKLLQKKAKRLKQNRLKRESAAAKIFNAKRQKRLRNEKKIVKKKKQMQACYSAREKENLAFRQRSKSRNLTAMRKALGRYEKKKMIRINKCQ
jgi:hypothetical protein